LAILAKTWKLLNRVFFILVNNGTTRRTKMKKILLTIIATALMTANLYALETKCEVNKDYFEICKGDYVYDSRRDREAYALGTVQDIFKNNEGNIMAIVFWPIHMGENRTETVSIDILSNNKGPNCMVNADEKVICKRDNVYDKRRINEAQPGGLVIRLFKVEGVKMALVSWPVIGGPTPDITSYREEEVKIDDLI
jgi:hypothetical protein